MLRSILTRVGNALGRGEDGAVMIEYALVVGIISIVLIVAFVTTGLTAGLGNVANAIGTVLSAVVFV